MTGEILDRRETAEAIEASAELLERLGAQHVQAARLLRRQLAGVAALRLAHRDRALVALRTTWFRELPTAAAAREIAAFLNRYRASKWRRRDCTLSEPPESYVGMPDELYFKIVALSGDKVPGVAAIRKIIAGTGKILVLESSTHFALASREMEKPPVTYVDAKLAATVKAMPGFQEAEARAIEAEIAGRKQHLDAIKKLDAEGARAFAPEEKRKDLAIAKVRQAERDLRTASVELDAVVQAVYRERLARETARRQHEGALLEGDFAAINTFCRDADVEMERTRKAVVSQEKVVRNRITRQVERWRIGNGASIKRRMAAILESIREAPNLRLLADLREIPDKLAAMRASWPPIGDVPPFPEDTDTSGAGRG